MCNCKIWLNPEIHCFMKNGKAEYIIIGTIFSKLQNKVTVSWDVVYKCSLHWVNIQYRHSWMVLLCVCNKLYIWLREIWKCIVYLKKLTVNLSHYLLYSILCFCVCYRFNNLFPSQCGCMQEGLDSWCCNNFPSTLSLFNSETRKKMLLYAVNSRAGHLRYK
jgi:hypothetical protein